jgi:acyl carrier protein
MSDVEEQLYNIMVVDLAVDRSSITPDTSIENIGPDPFKMAEFIASVEEALGIDIPDDDFDGLATVGDLIAYVKRRRG